MSKRQIDAILWRSYLEATSSALWELNNSQYYIELPKQEPDYSEFFGNSAAKAKDPQGNDLYTIQLAPFEGISPVGGYNLKIVKLRDGVERAGNLQVLEQRGESAYPLWQRDRGPEKKAQSMSLDERKKNFIVIVRDTSGLFHGRWIRDTDFDALPDRIKTLITSKTFGWSNL